MSDRRQVRVAPAFFDRLDRFLPPERTGRGLLSSADFLLHEIPPIIERLATDYERATTAVPGAAGVRMLITAGILVPYIVVYVTVAVDGAVELVELEADLGAAE